MPVDKDDKPLLPVSGGDWSYRIRCDKIPAKSQFDFFAPSEVVNEPAPKTPIGTSLFGSPQAASWISVKAKFQMLGRDREETVFQCPRDSYCETSGASKK